MVSYIWSNGYDIVPDDLSQIGSNIPKTTGHINNLYDGLVDISKNGNIIIVGYTDINSISNNKIKVFELNSNNEWGLQTGGTIEQLGFRVLSLSLNNDGNKFVVAD